MKREVLSLGQYKQLTDEERELLRQKEANAFLKRRLEAAKSAEQKPRLVRAAAPQTIRRFGHSSVRAHTKPMTKTQLIKALAAKMRVDREVASSALEAIVEVITEEVSSGGAVTLPGVGKIYCRERPERMVRNPATGEQIKKEADKVIKMVIAKALKDSING
jgi:DNA-binding protein HU-beta